MNNINDFEILQNIHKLQEELNILKQENSLLKNKVQSLESAPPRYTELF